VQKNVDRTLEKDSVIKKGSCTWRASAACLACCGLASFLSMSDNPHLDSLPILTHHQPLLSTSQLELFRCGISTDSTLWKDIVMPQRVVPILHKSGVAF
jgi:hypothetical protein